MIIHQGRLLRALPVAALLTAALVGVLGTLSRQTPRDPRTSPTDPLAENQLRARLDRLLDGRPHPVGSTAQESVKDRLRAELASLDLPVESWVRPACSVWNSQRCADVETLSVAIPGAWDSWVMVNAHTDSAPRSPGASDAGAGVAIAIAIADVWRTGTPGHGLWVVLDEGEELGLHGAQTVIDHPHFADTVAVVSLEARGSTGVSQLFRSLGDSGDLLAAYARAAPHPVVTTVSDHVFEVMPNDTNLTVFAGAGVPGVDFAFAEGVENYHTSGDTLANLDPRTLQSHADNAAAITRALLTTRPGPGRRSAFDIAGRFVIHWPLGWTLPGTLVIVLGGAARLFALRTRWRELARAAGAALATLTVGLGLGLALMLSPLDPFWCVPLLGLLLAGLLLGVGAWLRQPVAPLFAVLAAGWSLAALALALAAPGAAYLFAIPAALALVSLPAPRAAPALLLLGASLLWWPAADGFRTALGETGLPLSSFALWMPLIALLAWRAPPSGRSTLAS